MTAWVTVDPAQDPEIRMIALKEARGRLREVAAILEKGHPEPGTREFEAVWRHAHSLKGLGNVLGSREAERASVDVMRALDEMNARGVTEDSATRMTRDITTIADLFEVEDRQPHLR